MTPFYFFLALLFPALLLTPDAGETDEVQEQDGAEGEEDSVAATGELLEYDGSPTIEGTSGDDTLLYDADEAEEIDDLDPSQVHLYGGDDYAEAISNLSQSYYGGEGDDTIAMMTGAEGSIFGGSGDDSLSGNIATDIDGGAGNDTIAFSTNFVHDGFIAASGGSGDDIIAATVRAGFHNTDAPWAHATLGDGNDTVALTLLVDDTFPSDPDGAVREVDSGLTVIDFVKGEDVITVDVQYHATQEERALTGYEIETVATETGYENKLIFSFEGGETVSPSNAIVTVRSDAPLTRDDVTFV